MAKDRLPPNQTLTEKFPVVGEKDPGQKVNVIDDHPEVVAEMRAAYETFWKETRPLMVNESVPKKFVSAPVASTR